MASEEMEGTTERATGVALPTSAIVDDGRAKRRFNWRAMLGEKRQADGEQSPARSPSEMEQTEEKRPPTWSMGILNDRKTDEVPGSVLLLSEASEFNEPLGLRNTPARRSASSLPSPYPPSRAGSFRGSLRNSFTGRRQPAPKKKTSDGKFVLEPQPDDSLNDPLNWKTLKRDAALLSLGFYCMVGGGMTPVLAAGFHQVAAAYDVSVPRVALTTGLYMMGLGLGSVVLSPTAILFGKRPVYLAAAICFVLSAVWCALSPNFPSLIVARIFMGFAVSSVECLPSATVAEIYFLHEKAYRLGIYTLLLLGGKNLVPLVSAAIIQSLGWRWVFWMVAIVVSFGFTLLFLFVPETFWDRTPRPHKRQQRSHRFHLSFPSSPMLERKKKHPEKQSDEQPPEGNDGDRVARNQVKKHARFQQDSPPTDQAEEQDPDAIHQEPTTTTPTQTEKDGNLDYFSLQKLDSATLEAQTPSIVSPGPDTHNADGLALNSVNPYTQHFQAQPPKTFLQTLKPFSGRLSNDKWWRVAVRPFILFAYPSILWSTLVYALSIGWLIVLSESVSTIYESRDTYNFTALQTGLVYISPFVGGVLGTAVAGKLSDIIVRFLARRNGGLYEPEFRLVMGLPIAVFTTIGLMGYGWAAQERDLWIVPTVFFGFISFGCSLGSTTAITFAVDSYRQYAGEALVTLNFSKNVLHGLVFSLFFNRWLQAEGSKEVFIAIGAIQLACLMTTIPMYIYGKRARMWTARRNLMEKF